MNDLSGLLTFFRRPVPYVSLEHLVLEILAVHHRLGHIVKTHHTHELAFAEHGQVAGMALQHHAAHLVQLGVG